MRLSGRAKRTERERASGEKARERELVREQKRGRDQASKQEGAGARGSERERGGEGDRGKERQGEGEGDCGHRMKIQRKVVIPSAYCYKCDSKPRHVDVTQETGSGGRRKRPWERREASLKRHALYLRICADVDETYSSKRTHSIVREHIT